MNLHVGFRAVLPPTANGPVEVIVAANSVYRLHVGGRFVGHGPARGPHGRFRVDHWPLDGFLRDGETVVAIEVVGYNVNSYYLLDQPAFLVAEVVARDEVLASTAGEGVQFEAIVLDDHVQRVERYSVARTYSEAFRLRPDCSSWRTDLTPHRDAVPYDAGDLPPLLPRRVPYPDFRLVAPVCRVGRGQIARGPMPDEPYRDWTITGLGPDLKGYREEEFEVAPSLEWQAYRITEVEDVDSPVDLPIAVGEEAFEIFDFGVNQTGFIRLRLRCTEPTRLYILFDELLTDRTVDPRRLRCLNIIDCQVEAGTVEVETLEPYTLRYLQLAVLEGSCSVERLTLRTYANPEAAAASFACSDPRLERLFEAGRETLRQNALDLLMDCPSRERAGWPCDSFFTARAAFLLTGNTSVEQAFLENYAFAPQLESLPHGMLPMNYPGDHPNGDFLGVRDAQFIPNWPLWLVLQLEEYLERGGDRGLIDAFAPKVRDLFAWFAGYVNEEGLLEDLPGWIFLEWSKANDFVGGVNFPSNMLFAAALDAAGRLFGDDDWKKEACELRDTVGRMSFDGRFFVDQAIRNGRLQLTPHQTELCQYYAFSFGIASPESHPHLWETLRRDFGPHRDVEVTFSGIHPAAMLNGHILRLELLGRHGHGQQALEEALAFFGPMAEATGTLWEHASPSASCCHGFGSHVAVMLCRHVFGLEGVDQARRWLKLGERVAGFRGRLSIPLGEEMAEILLPEPT